MTQIPYTTERIIETIGGTSDFPLMLTKTSFGTNPSKWDIRRWRRDSDGTLLPLKGISLHDDEIVTLLHALTAALGDTDTQQDMMQDVTENTTTTTDDTQTQQ